MIFSYLLNMQSHPSWVCGLKRPTPRLKCFCSVVTPFVGVWIETPTISKFDVASSVTPFVGVWIETSTAKVRLFREKVTPFVGVWIETE